MPFTVADLIEDRPEPVTVRQSDSTQTALELMIEGDYSQLPVIDEDKRVSVPTIRGNVP
jgi:predicted transcriptional regulator